MKLILYIVQSEDSGILDEPEVFTDEADADACCLKWWNEELDENFQSMDCPRLAQAKDDANDAERFCHYWVTSVMLK